MRGTSLAIAVALALAALAVGCYTRYRIRHQPTVPDAPVNAAALNSPADDVNAAAPPHLAETFPLIFSTGRFGAGGNRLAAFTVSPEYYVHTAELVLVASPLRWDAPDAPVALLPDLPQYGPAIVPAGRPAAAGWDDVFDRRQRVRLAFAARTADAGLDLYLSDPFAFDDLAEADPIAIGSRPLAALNTPGDEAYLALGPGGTAVFAADGDLVQVAGFDSWERLLAAAPLARTPLAALNTAARETAASILGDRLLFVSDRPGGAGGLDVYLSRYAGGAWGAPARVERACSPADEMRPILLPYGGAGAERDGALPVDGEIADVDDLLLLFSSDRPGGKGGFDLYYVGLPRE